MATIKAEKRLRAPLLDRLLDQRPDLPQDVEQNQHQVLRQLRESVRRDIEQLFNTRARCISAPPEAAELRTSVLGYGLPDLANYNLVSSEGRRQICRDIEQVILRFEPRIRSVRVNADSARLDPNTHQFTFRAEATLRALLADEVLVFDSLLNPVSQTIDVTESIQ